MAVFGNSFVRATLDWPEFKNIVSVKRLQVQYDSTVDGYEIFAIDNSILYFTRIEKYDVSYTSNVSQQKNDEYKQDFIDNYKPLANKTSILKHELVDAYGESALIKNGNPAGLTSGPLIHGQDAYGIAQVPTLVLDENSGFHRLAIEGKISVSAPAAPALSTPVIISADNPLAITSTNNTEYIISSNKTFFIQQIVAGAAGDPTEKGSKVEVIYYDGTTEHIVERIYITGFTQFGIYPDTGKTRGGMLMEGNGSTKKIIVRRIRLSGSEQEVDVVVRGFEQ